MYRTSKKGKAIDELTCGILAWGGGRTLFEALDTGESSIQSVEYFEKKHKKSGGGGTDPGPSKWGQNCVFEAGRDS